MGIRPRIGLLLSRVDTGISPEILQARMEVLRVFVALLRKTFTDLFPEPGTITPGPVEHRSSRFPWPVCWELHPGLVELLWLFKEWHDALEDGEGPAGFREWVDWYHFLRTDIMDLVRDISGGSCRQGHVDLGRTPAPRPEKGIVRPPLPGEPVVEPPRPPVPDGWRKGFGEPPSPDDGVGR